MALAQLPTELHQQILRDVVTTQHFYRTLELRLVNREFDHQILEAVLTFSPKPHLRLISDALLFTGLRRRLLGGDTWRHIPVLDYILSMEEAIEGRANSSPLPAEDTSTLEALLRSFVRQPKRQNTYRRELTWLQPIKRGESAKIDQRYYGPQYIHFARAITLLASSKERKTDDEALDLVHQHSLAEIEHPIFGSLPILAGHFSSEITMYCILKQSSSQTWSAGLSGDSSLSHRLLFALEAAAQHDYKTLVKAILDNNKTSNLHQYPGPEDRSFVTSRGTGFSCALLPAATAAIKHSSLASLRIILNHCHHLDMDVLHIAAEHGNEKIVREFIDSKFSGSPNRGIRSTQRIEQLLQPAARSGNAHLLRYMKAKAAAAIGIVFWGHVGFRFIIWGIAECISYNYLDALAVLAAWAEETLPKKLSYADTRDLGNLYEFLAEKGSLKAMENLSRLTGRLLHIGYEVPCLAIAETVACRGDVEFLWWLLEHRLVTVGMLMGMLKGPYSHLSECKRGVETLVKVGVVRAREVEVEVDACRSTGERVFLVRAYRPEGGYRAGFKSTYEALQSGSRDEDS